VKDHVTLKTGVMMINSALIRNKLHFTVYSHRQQMIYTGVIYCIFVSNICSFNEQKIYYCYGGVDQKIGRLQTFGLFKTTTISFILFVMC